MGAKGFIEGFFRTIKICWSKRLALYFIFIPILIFIPSTVISSELGIINIEPKLLDGNIDSRKTFSNDSKNTLNWLSSSRIYIFKASQNDSNEFIFCCSNGIGPINMEYPPTSYNSGNNSGRRHYKVKVIVRDDAFYLNGWFHLAMTPVYVVGGFFIGYKLAEYQERKGWLNL